MITKLVISNIRSLHQKEFNFDKGIVVITGKNGSGKSTILNAIRFALSDDIDVPLREFRSLGAEDSDVTQVYIRVGNLQITKKIIPKSGKLRVTMDIIENGKSLTFPNLTTTKEYVLNTMGIQKYQFNNGIFIAQSAEIDMLTRPSTAKSFLIKLYGLDKYSVLYKKAGEVINEIDTQLSNIEGRMTVMRDSLSEPETNIDDLNAKLQEVIHKESVISTELSNLREKEVTLKTQYDTLIEAGVQKDLVTKQLRTIIQSLKRLPVYNEEDIINTKQDLVTLKKLRDESLATIQKDQQLYQIKHHSVSVIQSTQTCPVCNRQLSYECMLEIVKRLNSDLELIESEMDDAKQIINDSEELYEQLQLTIQNYIKTIDRKEELTNQGKELKKTLLELSSSSKESCGYVELRDKIDQLTHKLNTITSEIHDIKTEIAIYNEAQSRYDKTVNELAVLDKERTELLNRKTILMTLRRAYSSDGIPKYILESQASALEAMINENLEILSDGEMEVEFVTIRDGKEVFEVHVHNKGYWKSFNSLSGGEKKRVTLACSFGLSDFIQTPITWRIGDEIDADLDENGIRAVKRLVETKRDNYSQLILATLRPELIDLADQVIYLD